MFPKIVEFGRFILSDPMLGRLGRMMKLYWLIVAINAAQMLFMVFGPDHLKHGVIYQGQNAIGSIALVLMIVASLAAGYQHRKEAAPQAD